MSILYEINPFVPTPPFLYPLKTSLKTNGLMCDNRFIINTHSLSNRPEKKKLCITNKHISKQPGFQNTRHLLTMKYISTSMESLKHLLNSRNDLLSINKIQLLQEQTICEFVKYLDSKCNTTEF